MIIYRCLNCGETTFSIDEDGTPDYSEEWDSTPHKGCKQKPSPAEEKLLQVISGKPPKARVNQ